MTDDEGTSMSGLECGEKIAWNHLEKETKDTKSPLQMNKEEAHHIQCAFVARTSGTHQRKCRKEESKGEMDAEEKRREVGGVNNKKEKSLCEEKEQRQSHEDNVEETPLATDDLLRSSSDGGGGGGGGANVIPTPLESAHALSVRGDEAFKSGYFEKSKALHSSAAKLFKHAAKELQRREDDPSTLRALKVLAKSERRKSRIAQKAIRSSGTTKASKSSRSSRTPPLPPPPPPSTRSSPVRNETHKEDDIGVDGTKNSKNVENDPSVISKSPASKNLTKDRKLVVPQTKQRVWEAYQNLRVMERRLMKDARSLSPVPATGHQSLLGESFLVVPQSKQRRHFPMHVAAQRGRANASTRARDFDDNVRSRDISLSSSSSLSPPTRNSELMSRSDDDAMHSQLRNQECEIVRLLQTIDRLSRENTQLLQDTQETARLRRENDDLREQMVEFRESYRRRFTELKFAMEEMTRREKERNDAVMGACDPATAKRFALSREKSSIGRNVDRDDDVVVVDVKRRSRHVRNKSATLATSYLRSAAGRLGQPRSRVSTTSKAVAVDALRRGERRRPRQGKSRKVVDEGNMINARRRTFHRERAARNSSGRSCQGEGEEGLGRRRPPRPRRQEQSSGKALTTVDRRRRAHYNRLPGERSTGNSVLMSSTQSALDFPFARSISEF